MSCSTIISIILSKNIKIRLLHVNHHKKKKKMSTTVNVQQIHFK